MPLKNKQTLTAFIGKVLDTGVFSLVVKVEFYIAFVHSYIGVLLRMKCGKQFAG